MAAKVQQFGPSNADDSGERITGERAPVVNGPPLRPQSFYFGSDDRALFGSVRVPPGGWTKTRVLLCAPLGYEGLFAHITLSELATNLAETCGAIVMTFDYDGAGDSSGTDEDGGRIERVLSSIDQAIDHLATIGDPSGPIVVIGLRTGALLAAHAVARRSDIVGVALWAPCTGRTFLREQRAFSMVTHSNPRAPDGDAKRWGPRGFEANGYVFSDETIAVLDAMSFKTLERPPAPAVLVLNRKELKASPMPPGWSAANFEEHAAPGYAEMMEPPWLWMPPTEAFQRLAEWVQRRGGGTPAALAAPDVGGAHVASVGRGIEESPMWFGQGDRRFGILTRPPRPTSHAAVLVTSTYGYRIGPNRLNVVLARRLAESGIATLRIDIGGVGDSRTVRGLPPPIPYDMEGVADVSAAIAYLRRAGYSRISLTGVCAGAFLAWQAAARETEPVQLALANLESFEPVPYDRATHMSFQIKRPSFRERFDAATLSERVALVAQKSRRARALAGQILRASLPTRLRRDGLPAQLSEFGQKGSRLALLYSTGDLGLQEYYVNVGVHHLPLTRRGVVSIEIVDGADHSFTPRWAVDELVDRIVREFESWSTAPRSAV